MQKNIVRIMKAAQKKGMRRVIDFVPVHKLAIDESYQTPNRTERDLNYLIANWDERKLLPLVVVFHEEEGKFYIVDGYGRLTASQQIDSVRYSELECLIILDAPTDPEARRRFEAEQYAFQNANVARMKPAQKHGALIILGDKSAKIVEEIQGKYGFDISPNRGNRNCNVLGSYTDIYNIASRHGKECLDWIFTTCKGAGLDRKANGYCRGIIYALRDMWSNHYDRKDEVGNFLAAYMRSETPDLLASYARAKYPKLNPVSAESLFIEDITAKALGFEPKRKAEGNRIIRISA